MKKKILFYAVIVCAVNCISCTQTAGTNVLAPRVFNVLNYGAVGDDKTDNTAAFSACIKDVIEAGGGRMYIPDGVYRGRIIIPGTKNWITVEIVGESEPTPMWGTILAFPFQKNGTILKCLDKSGPAVIYADNKPEKLYMRFSGVYVVMRNLDVRTYDDPGISGIDLLNAAQCKLENVFVNTDRYNVQASQPTHGTAGIITPGNSNGAITILRNVMVTGYHTGILVNEHTNGDNINLGSNFNGLEFAFAHHASRFGRICAQRCTRSINVTGKHGFCIEQLDIEVTGPGQTDKDNKWQASDFDFHDPKNLGIGDINYWVVEGNVGAVERFNINGGKNIRARRIGSAQESAESSGSAGTSKQAAYSLDDIMTPFWETDKMINESVLMVSAGNDPPKAKLLFPAIKILSVKNAALNKTYKEGVDWVYENDTLSLLPGSAAPSLTMKQMYPAEKKKGWTFPKKGGGFVRFREGHYFHDHQLAVTYTHKKGQWKGPVPKYAEVELARTLGKLKAGKPLKIVLYGDSITVGGNASGFTGAEPSVPAFGELFAEYLRSVYDSKITTENTAVGGQTSSWGVANVNARVTSKKPDLVVLAFGMNDGTGKMDPDVFLKNIRAMIQGVKEGNPEAEFILVAPTVPNPETFFVGEQVNYGPKLKMLAGKGVQVIDMTSVHQELLKRKHFRDMTGNNINHPNDFLHRWHAQQLAGLLVDRKK